MFENLWDGLWFINCLGSIAFCSYEQFKRWWTHSVRSFLHASIIFKLSNNFRHHSLFIFRQCAACLYIPQCLCVSQSGLDKLVEVALTTLRPWWRHVLQYNYKVDSSSTTGLSKVCVQYICAHWWLGSLLPADVPPPQKELEFVFLYPIQSFFRQCAACLYIPQCLLVSKLVS